MELYMEHVSKQFKDLTAVDDISLRITPGVWGLLGANGAGKTTLMRMIAGIMKPTAGKILYDGIPINELKESYRDTRKSADRQTDKTDRERTGGRGMST